MYPCSPNTYVEVITLKPSYLEVGPLGVIRFRRGDKGGGGTMELVLFQEEEETGALSLLCEATTSSQQTPLTSLPALKASC